jgi:uncharacterized glyoxalase superfamily protein PhnB
MGATERQRALDDARGVEFPLARRGEVVRELTDQDYGSRGYAVRDLEGNHWSFGTYDHSC